MALESEILLPARDYNLAATLDSGQSFRWRLVDDGWHGVIGNRSVWLTQTDTGIHAQTAAPVENWDWLRNFLQSETELAAVLGTFPDDPPMREAVAVCRGLRLLRQDPWECLASFILSSTKQITQIRRIVADLCERFGEPIEAPKVAGEAPARSEAIARFAFPTPQRIAAASEVELRECKMGFRAPNLLAAARQVNDGALDLESIREMHYAAARAELMKLRGVGGKIADCVLLFAYGFDGAFPVDVWVARALEELYFPHGHPGAERLREFTATHFGPHAGYAQQYLFHYMRTRRRAPGKNV